MRIGLKFLGTVCWLTGIALVPAPALAALLTGGNILTAGGTTLYEYTSTGTLVQSFSFASAEGLRDVAVGPSGEVYAYNGTFSPSMTTLNPATSSYTSLGMSGWSTVNNISYGGIDTFGGYVYATDMNTASPGTPQGIVRFDLAGGTSGRYATTQEYIDLTIGGDGRLYALRQSTTVIDVLDPVTMVNLDMISLQGAASSAGVRGIAADASGMLYAAAWNGSVYRIDDTGTVQGSRSLGGNLSDINLDNLGRLVIARWFGNVVLTDTSFSSTATLAGIQPNHVAFTSPLTVVSTPEPSTWAASLALLLIGSLARRRTQRGRAVTD